MRSREGNLHLSRENFAAATRTMTRTTGLHRMARSDVHQVSKYRRATALTLQLLGGPALTGQEARIPNSFNLSPWPSARPQMCIGCTLGRACRQWSSRAPWRPANGPHICLGSWSLSQLSGSASVLHVSMDRPSPNARGGVGVGTIGKCGRRRFVWYLKVIGVPI